MTGCRGLGCRCCSSADDGRKTIGCRCGGRRAFWRLDGNAGSVPCKLLPLLRIGRSPGEAFMANRCERHLMHAAHLAQHAHAHAGPVTTALRHTRDTVRNQPNAHDKTLSIPLPQPGGNNPSDSLVQFSIYSCLYETTRGGAQGPLVDPRSRNRGRGGRGGNRAFPHVITCNKSIIGSSSKWGLQTHE